MKIYNQVVGGPRGPGDLGFGPTEVERRSNPPCPYLFVRHRGFLYILPSGFIIHTYSGAVLMIGYTIFLNLFIFPVDF